MMMSSSKQTMIYRDFTGGMCDEENVANIKVNEVSAMINANPLTRGGYEKRKGCSKYTENAFASGVARLFYYKDDKWVIFGTTLQNWSGSKILTTTLSSNDIQYFIFKDILYILDGTKYYQYDGTIFQEVPEITTPSEINIDHIKRCRYGIKRGARVFAAGDSQYPNFLYYGAIGDAANIPFGNAMYAAQEDDDQIMGLWEFASNLIIFQRKHTYGWSGWDPASDVQFNKLPVHRGTETIRSVEDAEGMVLYYGLDGIYALTSAEQYQVNSDPLSETLNNTIRSITNPDKAVGIYYKGKYLLAVCTDGSGINNKVLVGHMDLLRSIWPNKLVMPWSIYTGWQVNDWFVDSDTSTLYFGSNDGNIYKAFDTNSDNGVAIDMYVKHKMDLTKMFFNKKIKSMLVGARQYVAESSKITVKINVDYSSTEYVIDLDESLVWDEGTYMQTLWGWIDSVTKEMPLRMNGNYLTVEISNNEVDQPVTVYGLAFYTKIKSKPKGVKLGVYSS